MTPITLEFLSAEAPPIKSTLADAGTYVLGFDGVFEPEGPDTAGQLRLVTQLPQLCVAPVAGTSLMVNGKPATELTAIQHGDWVTVGTLVYQLKLATSQRAGAPATPLPPPATLSAQPTLRATPHATLANEAQVLIGRHANCTLTIDSPLVSREHTRLTMNNGRWLIEDLGSVNGTFINGRRIRESVALKVGDRVGIATFLYRFTGDGLRADGEEGRVRIEALGISKTIHERSSGQPRHLLEDISLVIEPGEFMVIFGGSGSGKSTLLDTLNGRRPATGGRVLYNGVDLATSFDMYRSSIGYVPQQDIVHRRIKMRRALAYTARLRLPADTAEHEITAYLDEVLKSVRLQDQADLLIDTPAPLSGGQLKRVSLAAELIAKPGVLFLDEVTSGLDAGTDRQMMQTFAELADGGKTVVCVTHTLENIAACQLVTLLHRGRLAYFGPPGEVQDYFKIPRLSDIYEVLDTQPPEHWAAQYLASPLRERYVVSRLSPAAQAPASAVPVPSNVRTSAPGSGFWRQSKILTQRYLDLLVNDKRNLAILLLQAPLIGAVVGAVFDTSGVAAASAATQSQVAFMLVLSAIWFGCLNSAREIVKELPIYLRERAVNLALAPYVFSKLLPLAGLCFLQCLLLLSVVTSLLALPGEFLPRLGLLTACAFAASVMGLAISAFVDTNDKAIALVPILLIPQVVLSNALTKLAGANLWIAKLSMISFWGYDGLKSTLSAAILGLRDPSGAPLVPVLESYRTSLGAISLLTLAFLVLVGLGLKLKDRKT
jgi:ABC transport system ATP-binding/permease protein